MRRTNTKVAALTIVLLPLGWAACGDDYPGKEFIVGPDASDYPVATSPDLLVGNLTRAYDERNHEEYDDMLADGFVFYFAPAEVEQLGRGESYDRAQDTKSTYNLFHSRPGQDKDGNAVPPVKKLQLTLTPDDTGSGWTDQVAEEFAGTSLRRYRVDMRVTYTDGSREQVTGLQEFYVISVEVPAEDGTPITVYQLKFWRDLGKEVTKARAGADSKSWGAVKALF